MPYRPHLKISNLTHLQDARYSAAVGFDFVSFSLARGHHRKLPPSLVWNMIQWLEGPEIILELNADSWEEVRQVGKESREFWAALPATEWTEDPPVRVKGVILRGNNETSSDEISHWVSQSPVPLKVELSLDDLDQLVPFSSVYPHIFVNFPEMETTKTLIRSSAYPVFGLSFREEAEESPGMLDYDALDACLELMGLEL